jgi:HSP20 family molecular chaperone IbpA
MNTTTNGTRTTPTPSAAPRRTTVPRVDIYENQDEVLLFADVPGATGDGVNVELDKGELSIRARRGGDATGPDYERVFRVSPDIDASKIEAELANGVLRVRLPKADALRPRKIQVKAS